MIAMSPAGRSKVPSPILPNLPEKELLAALAKAPGNEIASGKLNSPESSAALAVNTFGLFLGRAKDLPRVPGLPRIEWSPTKVSPEQCLRFPWRGGRHPWLDAVIWTPSHLIGVESKRYEPFRGAKAGTFSPAYSRSVWGKRMRPFEVVRDQLSDGALQYEFLDAVQLVKHAFGIRTQAEKQGLRPILMYLYAQPSGWPGGPPISEADHSRHLREIRDFARRVDGAEVEFSHCSYRRLLAAFAASKVPEVRQHANAIRERFDV
jgi:hypothetical protein